MTTTTLDRPQRPVVIYARVSSEDQKTRLTILTQLEELRTRILGDDELQLVAEYVDDGVSGTVPMHERPDGSRLMADARGAIFDEVWVWKLDRIGRDGIDPLVVRRDLERLGVKVCSLHDHAEGELEYSIRVAIAAEERRTFRLRSAAGMTRAAKEGRYCGGIVPIGYKVEGKKNTARLVISDDPMWQSWSESDVVREIFRRSACDGQSCRTIAEEFNRLGIPTAYQKAGRSVRLKNTRGEWTPGRIRQILTSTVYKGEYIYGKRGKREPISASVPAIVTAEDWDEAQRTLARNNLRPKHAQNVFLLRSIIKCGECGLNFSGTVGRDVVWYRCNGQIAWRGKLRGHCKAKSLDGRVIEPQVWDVVERWLLRPGDVLDELAAEQNANGTAAVAAAQIEVLRAQLATVPDQRNGVLDLLRKKLISSEEVERQLQAIVAEQEALEARLRALEPQAEVSDVYTPESLLSGLRKRIRAGLTPEERQRVVSILVKRLTVHTEIIAGKKRASVIVEFRFPAVDDDYTGMGSSRRPA
jgi:site-specific DNA recombinase